MHSLTEAKTEENIVQIWTEGSYASYDHYGGAASLILDQGYDHTPQPGLLRRKPYVFSSTQVGMIAILNAVLLFRDNYVGRSVRIFGRSVRIFSDSKSSISSILISFWKYSISDTKSPHLLLLRRRKLWHLAE